MGTLALIMLIVTVLCFICIGITLKSSAEPASEPASSWECDTCGAGNAANALQCSQCGMERPA